MLDFWREENCDDFTAACVISLMATSPFDIELDEMTIARAQRGDRQARAQIFRDFHQPAWSIAMRLCHCRETAHDVTQEAFISAFRRLKQFRGDSPFWGWLRRVVINHAISHMRRAPNATIVELHENHALTQGHQERIGQSMDLEAALSLLDEADRTIVWLHDVEGYSHAEIAAEFGRTESFSKTRLSRARARLRELVGSQDQAPLLGETARQI